MNGFNRVVAILLWVVLLVLCLIVAIAPLLTIAWLQAALSDAAAWLSRVQAENPTYFVVGQAALGIGAILILGALLFFEVSTVRRRGVRIRTGQRGAASAMASRPIGRSDHGGAGCALARRLGGHPAGNRDRAGHRHPDENRRSGGCHSRHHRAGHGAAAG